MHNSPGFKDNSHLELFWNRSGKLWSIDPPMQVMSKMIEGIHFFYQSKYILEFSAIFAQTVLQPDVLHILYRAPFSYNFSFFPFRTRYVNRLFKPFAFFVNRTDSPSSKWFRYFSPDQEQKDITGWYSQRRIYSSVSALSPGDQSSPTDTSGLFPFLALVPGGSPWSRDDVKVTRRMWRSRDRLAIRWLSDVQ